MVFGTTILGSNPSAPARMMKKISINSKNAPEAIGPYSQAIRKGNIVFLSGQIPLDPKTMELVDGIEGQIKQVFEKYGNNIKLIIVAPLMPKLG